LRNALFWVITQRVVVISYRRFRTIYRSHFQGSSTVNYSSFRQPSHLSNVLYFDHLTENLK